MVLTFVLIRLLSSPCSVLCRRFSEREVVIPGLSTVVFTWHLVFEYSSIFSLADVPGVAGRLHFKLQGDLCVQQSSVLVREVFDQTDWPALTRGVFGTDKAEDTRQAQ